MTYVDGRLSLFYIGVSPLKTVDYSLAIGLAISDDHGESFRRAFPGPVLSTGPHDPIGVTAGCVLKTNGYRMWYSYVAGGLGYRSGYAESPDGLEWTRRDEDGNIYGYTARRGP